MTAKAKSIVETQQAAYIYIVHRPKWLNAPRVRRHSHKFRPREYVDGGILELLLQFLDTILKQGVVSQGKLLDRPRNDALICVQRCKLERRDGEDEHASETELVDGAQLAKDTGRCAQDSGARRKSGIDLVQPRVPALV